MNPETLHKLAAADPVLGNIIREVPFPEIHSTDDVFHDLMSCIIEQQIHYRSTKKIFQKGLERAGLTQLTLSNFAVFEERAISQLKLSRGKYETLQRVLDFFDSNQINWTHLSDEEVISRLSSIKGIGRWTIDMILTYTLKRPDVFPVDDFHLKRLMVSLYGLNEKVKLKAQMLDVAQSWGNEKSLAVLYLFAWKTFRKTK